MNALLMFLLFSGCIFLTVLLSQNRREPKFAPYVLTQMLNTWNLVHPDGIRKYGLNAVTLAFVHARNDCLPLWNENDYIDDHDYISRIRAFRAAGGDIIISTGGAAPSNYYLENHCPSASALAGAYRRALNASHSTHLDLDIEANIPIDTVTKAVAQIQWESPRITFSLTIGSNEKGIHTQGVNILRSAVRNGVRVDVVNALTMDFKSNKLWGNVVPLVAEATHKQLKKIWPRKSDQELYCLIGLTPMIGRNDQGKTFTLGDAHKVVRYANSKNIGQLAFWNLGRDNGNCPGIIKPSNNCSGIAQGDHEFTRIFNKFKSTC